MADFSNEKSAIPDCLLEFTEKSAIMSVYAILGEKVLFAEQPGIHQPKTEYYRELEKVEYYE